MPKQRRRRNNTSSRFISDDDLAVEIFIRLPDRKSEVNCSAVCKRWLSIINSVHFRNKKLQRHQSQSQPLPCTFLFRNHGNGDSISIPFYQYFTEESKILHRNDTSSSSSYLDFLPWEKVRIHSSFNDLLLLSRWYEYGRHFMICNPFTKQWIELPQPHIHVCASIETGGAGLFCEPIKPPPPPPQQQQQQHPLKLDLYRYKVMIMCYWCQHENGQVEFCALTYCSEIGTWRESTFSLHQRTLNSNAPVACNGLLYWLVGSTEEETVDGIFAF